MTFLLAVMRKQSLLAVIDHYVRSAAQKSVCEQFVLFRGFEAVDHETKCGIERAKTDAKPLAGSCFVGWFVSVFFKPRQDIGYLGDQVRRSRVD